MDISGTSAKPSAPHPSHAVTQAAFDTPPVKLSLDELALKVARTELGSMASVVHRILSIVRDQKSDAHQLMHVVEMDPVLAAKLLKRVNSAMSGLTKRISSIQQAIIMLGFNAVKELTLSLQIANVFAAGTGSPWYSRKALWKHSLAVAIMAKLIYRRQFRERGDDIYSISLLHDIGIIAEDEVMPQLFSRMLDTATATSSILVAEDQVFGYSHDAVAATLCPAWKFPQEMSDIISAHHTPPDPAGTHFRAAGTLFLADYYCHAANYGFDFSVATINKAPVEEVGTALGLTAESIALIAADVKTQIDTMEADGALFE